MIFFWIVLSFVAGFMGSNRKIGFFGAFLLSLILSPVIGIIFVLVSKDKRDELWQQKLLDVIKNQNKSNSSGIGSTYHKNEQNEKFKNEIRKMITNSVESLNLNPLNINECIPLLTSKSWKKIDASFNYEKILTFRKNNDLLIEYQENVTKYKWDVIKSRNSILLDINDSHGLYNILYIDMRKIVLSMTGNNKAKSYLLLAEVGSIENSISKFFEEINYSVESKSSSQFPL